MAFLVQLLLLLMLQHHYNFVFILATQQDLSPPFRMIRPSHHQYQYKSKTVNVLRKYNDLVKQQQKNQAGNATNVRERFVV